jgi:hypothetical protein
MNLKLRPLTLLIVICLLPAPWLRAQEDATNDSDLAKMMKEAEEMQKEAADIQKKNPPAPGAKKKTIAEMQAEAKEEMARQEQEEKEEKANLQAALKKQLAEPGPVALPDWTPPTPQFKAAGSPTKKIVDDEVKIVVTGTSPLTPEELADGWEAAVADKKVNHVRNNISSNGNLTVIMFLSTRTDPVQKVELDARRAPGEKISRVEISSPLSKPGDESE